jgi:hypothetical protein
MRRKARRMMPLHMSMEKPQAHFEELTLTQKGAVVQTMMECRKSTKSMLSTYKQVPIP